MTQALCCALQVKDASAMIEKRYVSKVEAKQIPYKVTPLNGVDQRWSSTSPDLWHVSLLPTLGF